MDYCLGAGDGSASMWSEPPDTDLDGDGALDALRLDVDHDDRLDDLMADLDRDGLADHAVLDLDDDGAAETFFVDDGSGTWAVSVESPLAVGTAASPLRWFGLDGLEHPGDLRPVDVDGDGTAGDRLVDTDGDGLADQAFSGDLAYVDTDGDGRWDVKLADADGDGTADTASSL